MTDQEGSQFEQNVLLSTHGQLNFWEISRFGVLNLGEAEP